MIRAAARAIAPAIVAIVWAFGPAAACASGGQSTDGQPVTTTVIVDGQLVKDAVTSPDASGLIVGAIPVSPAEAARRQAADTTKSRTLKVYRDRALPTATETIVSTKDVVVSTTPDSAAACVQIGAVGAQANCRMPKP